MPEAPSPLASLHPAVARWFAKRFSTPTPPQALGWPAIRSGRHALILSPTGSGKTLAAFLVAIGDILDAKEQGLRPPKSGVHTLYVSPLKALNADVHANLEGPLEGIREEGGDIPAITRAIRTGDTPQGAREAMVRNPPDILITTPESLYLLLTSERSRKFLGDVKTVILDEIHSVVGSKRGAHLALTLERLELLSPGFQRVGLSATVKPPEEAARFLGGSSASGPRPVALVDARAPKALDLLVEWPQAPLVDEEQAEGEGIAGETSGTTGAGARPVVFGEGTAWPAIDRRIRELVDSHHTTLIFANNRRLAERLARRLTDLNPARPLAAHHGSLSRERRRQLEQGLKSGSVPGVVATSSLELGIDIGEVDLVVHVGSPRTVGRGLQRVGRAGHQVGQTSVGRFFPTHRADLLETAAIVRGMREGNVEETRTPNAPLDVLAQQVVAHVAASEEAPTVDALLAWARGAWSYRDLPREKLLDVLELLAGKYPAEAFRELRPRLEWDRRRGVLRPLRGSRQMAIRNGGTIPDRGTYGVYLVDGRTRLGELDEEFVFESRVGEVFALGTNAWRILAIEENRVVVEDAHGEPPKAPFWRGDQAPRDLATSLDVGRFLRHCEEQLTEGTLAPWAEQAASLDPDAAEALRAFLAGQAEKTGRLPSDRIVAIEHFRDETGDPRIAVHAPFGAAVNGPWALGLARLLGERYGAEVQSFVGDDGFLLRFPDVEDDVPFEEIRNAEAEEIVRAAVSDLGDTALFAGRFRECAERALLLPRPPPGQRRPLWVQRLRANDLLQAARQFEDFPILAEAYRDILAGPVDLEGLRSVLQAVRRGEIAFVDRVTDEASPFAQTLLFGFVGAFLYEGDPPKSSATRGRTGLRPDILAEVLDPKSFHRVLRREAVEAEVAFAEGRSFPPRNAEELAAALARVGDVDEEEAVVRWGEPVLGPLRELGEGGRVVRLRLPRFSKLVLAEDAPLYRAAFSERTRESGAPLGPRRDRAGEIATPIEEEIALAELARGKHPPAGVLRLLFARGLAAEGVDGAPITLPREEDPPRRQARIDIISRFARTRGPFRARDVAERYGISEEDASELIGELTEERALARGRFSEGALEDQFLDRKILEGAHRRSLALLRKAAEPVDGAAYARFLLDWQGVALRARKVGRAGLAEALERLAGAALAGEIWERDVLPARVEKYPSQALGELTSGGAIVWVGAGQGRFRPLVRGEAAAYMPSTPVPDAQLSAKARSVRAILREEGASFFNEIASTMAAPDVAEGLAELVRLGEATNDSFEVMRHVLRTGTAVIPRDAPARRLRASALSGRWSLTHRAGIVGAPLDEDARARRLAADLLRRFGLVAHEVAQVDGTPMPWSELRRVYARMEARGELRRGYFVRGLSGEQYATTEVVERLRDARVPGDPADAIVVNVLDPANPWGASLPMPPVPRFSRSPRNYLVLLRGEPILLAGREGRDLIPMRALTGAEIQAAARALHRLLDVPPAVRRRRSVVVESWAGRPVASGHVPREFLDAGFELEHGKLVLWPSHARAD